MTNPTTDNARGDLTGTISARFPAIQALVPNADGENASGRRRALSAIIPSIAERVYAEFDLARS
jgi:hypothetical protein